MENKTLSDEMMEAFNDIDKIKFLGNTREQEVFKLALQTAFAMNKKHLQEFKEELIKKLTSPCALHCETLGIIDTQMQKHFGKDLI